MAVYQTDKVLSFGDLVSDVSTVQKYPLGTRRDQDGQVYRYVKRNDSTVAFASGDVVYRAGGVTSGALWEVSGDLSDQDSAFAVGIAVSSIADSGFGWVKTKGLVTNLKKKAGTAAFSLVKGDAIIASGANASDDGRAQRIVVATSTKVSRAELRAALERIIGFCASAATNSATSVTAYIDLE